MPIAKTAFNWVVQREYRLHYGHAIRLRHTNIGCYRRYSECALAYRGMRSITKPALLGLGNGGSHNEVVFITPAFSEFVAVV
jgi:hypothetical protein